MQPKVHWVVGLSNGENATEGRGNFQIIEGAPSPWQRLLAYLQEHKLHITSLSLGTADGRRWNIPSAGKTPKFRELADAPKPIDYRMFRKAAMEQRQDGTASTWGDKHTCIEALYGDGKRLQVWVDEDTLTSWSMIV